MVLSGVCIGLVFLLVDAVPQDPSYHAFVDGRTKIGIPNFWNVVSNIPFFIVGLTGLLQLHRCQVLPELQIAYKLLFSGVLLVSIGSGYYHLNPTNMTLVWDRLPMTIAFMALTSIVIAEHLDPPTGKRLLLPLLIVGVASVVWWHYTESRGQGDLRLYGLVQFLPLLLIPLLLLLRQNEFVVSGGYWSLILFYGIAKLFEAVDEPLFAATGLLSGHPLKHVAAAIGVYLLLDYYKKRPRALGRINPGHP